MLRTFMNKPGDLVTIKQIVKTKDRRGWLAEIVRPEDLGSKTSFGQIFLTVSYPGQIKGNHFHKRKTEWYCVVKGKGLLTIRENSSGEKRQYKLSDKKLRLVTIPPGYSHNIQNIGVEEMHLLVYINEAFKQSDPDTYATVL